MTVNATFDTHAFVKRLISVGFTEEQAEVLAEEPSHLIQERFATKQDVESLRLEIQRELRELEYRMVIKLGSMSEGKGQPAPWDHLKNQIYLGSDQFVEDMQRKMDPGQSLDDIPNPQKQSPVKPLSYYEKRYGVRNRSMAEAYRSGHYTLKNIGDYFGVSYATVSRALKEFNV